MSGFHSQDLLLPVLDAKPRPLPIRPVLWRSPPTLPLPLLHLQPPLVLLTFFWEGKDLGRLCNPALTQNSPHFSSFFSPSFFLLFSSVMHRKNERLTTWASCCTAIPSLFLSFSFLFSSSGEKVCLTETGIRCCDFTRQRSDNPGNLQGHFRGRFPLKSPSRRKCRELLDGWIDRCLFVHSWDQTVRGQTHHNFR